MSAADAEVTCRCDVPARVSRVVLAAGGEAPTMIELMHVNDDGRHEHEGADLEALMGRLALVNEPPDDGDGY